MCCNAIRKLRRCWNVEVFFNFMTQDRPQPRSKTIQAHVTRFCAFVHRVCLGTMLRLTSRWVLYHG